MDRNIMETDSGYRFDVTTGICVHQRCIEMWEGLSHNTRISVGGYYEDDTITLSRDVCSFSMERTGHNEERTIEWLGHTVGGKCCYVVIKGWQEGAGYWCIDTVAWRSRSTE